LFINPASGPRVRLRAILLDAELSSTGAVEFNRARAVTYRAGLLALRRHFKKRFTIKLNWGLMSCRAEAAFTADPCAITKWRWILRSLKNKGPGTG
jgi:hypothetical protein